MQYQIFNFVHGESSIRGTFMEGKSRTEIANAIVKAASPCSVKQFEINLYQTARQGPGAIGIELTYPHREFDPYDQLRASFAAIGVRLTEFSVGLYPTLFLKGKIMAIQNSRNPNVLGHINGTKDFFVILNPESNLPITQTFDTADEAWEVADQMAQKCVGQRFFVLGSFGSAVAAHPIVRRESKLGQLITPKKVTRKIATKATGAKIAAKKPTRKR